MYLFEDKTDDDGVLRVIVKFELDIRHGIAVFGEVVEIKRDR